MTPAASIDLAIIILNYNTREALRACLRSLLREGSTTLSDPTAPIRASTVVVDNASEDGSAEMVAQEFPWATLIRSPRNGGFAYGNNLALRQVTAERVMLLNPDTEVTPGALRLLIAAFQRHPRAGIVGPRLLRDDGTMHLACRRSFPSPAVAFFRLSGLSRLFPRSRVFGRYNLTFLDPNLEVQVDSVCGACMVVRGDVLEQIGLLDERFFMYGEDVDWCWRAKEAEWEVWYVPDAIVRHQHGAAGRRRVLRTTFHFFRAMDLFFRKHYAARYNPVARGLVIVGIYAALAASLVRLWLTPPAHRRVGL